MTLEISRRATLTLAASALLGHPVCAAGALPPRADWMAALPGTRLLADLTIPGTHDSAARLVLPIASTQSATIAEQLEAGIRFFDIRVAWRDAALRLFHGPVPLHLRFDADIVEICRGFLALHPGETVILLLTNEGHDQQATVEAALRAAMDRAPLDWPASGGNATLAEVRGKILLIRRFAIPPHAAALGLDASGWRDNATFALTTPGPRPVRFRIQDQYIVPSIAAIEDKWRHVATLIPPPDTPADGVWRLNYCSATSGHVSPQTRADPVRALCEAAPTTERPIPLDVATGIDGVAGINQRLLALLRLRRSSVGLGTFMLDFAENPNDFALVDALIATNRLG